MPTKTKASKYPSRYLVRLKHMLCDMEPRVQRGPVFWISRALIGLMRVSYVCFRVLREFVRFSYKVIQGFLAVLL